MSQWQESRVKFDVIETCKHRWKIVFWIEMLFEWNKFSNLQEKSPPLPVFLSRHDLMNAFSNKIHIMLLRIEKVEPKTKIDIQTKAYALLDAIYFIQFSCLLEKLAKTIADLQISHTIQLNILSLCFEVNRYWSAFFAIELILNVCERTKWICEKIQLALDEMKYSFFVFGNSIAASVHIFNENFFFCVHSRS